MKCNNCSTEFDGNFCPVCGIPKPQTVAPSSPEPPTEYTYTNTANPSMANAKKKRKISTPLIITIIVVSLVIIGGGIFGFFKLKEFLDPSNQVVSALESGDYESALSLSSNIDEPSEKLINELESKLESVYTDFKNDIIDYEVAILELDNINKLNIPEISTKYKNIYEKVETLNVSKSAFETALAFEQQGNYISAINQYKQVIEDDSNYKTAKENLSLVTEKYRDSVLDKAEEYANEKDYKNTLSTLNYGLNIIENDSVLAAQITLYSDTYEAECLSEADDLVSKQKFDEAETILNEAEELIGDREKINNKLEEISKLKPVNLFDTTVLYDGYYMEKILSTDEETFIIGKSTYTEGFTLSTAYYTDPYALFDLQGDYSSITFEVGRVSDGRAGDDIEMQIYLDGKLSEQHSLSASSPSEKFTIDLKNAKSMKIMLTEGKYVTYGFVNVTLTP